MLDSLALRSILYHSLCGVLGNMVIVANDLNKWLKTLNFKFSLHGMKIFAKND